MGPPDPGEAAHQPCAPDKSGCSCASPGGVEKYTCAALRGLDRWPVRQQCLWGAGLGGDGCVGDP